MELEKKSMRITERFVNQEDSSEVLLIKIVFSILNQAIKKEVENKDSP